MLQNRREFFGTTTKLLVAASSLTLASPCTAFSAETEGQGSLREAIETCGAERLLDLFQDWMASTSGDPFWSNRYAATLGPAIRARYATDDVTLESLRDAVRWDRIYALATSGNSRHAMEASLALSAVPGFRIGKDGRPPQTSLDHLGYMDMTFAKFTFLLEAGGDATASGIARGRIDWTALDDLHHSSYAS